MGEGPKVEKVNKILTFWKGQIQKNMMVVESFSVLEVKRCFWQKI